MGFSVIVKIYSMRNGFTMSGEAVKVKVQAKELTYMGCVCIVMVLVLGKDRLFFSDAQK